MEVIHRIPQRLLIPGVGSFRSSGESVPGTGADRRIYFFFGVLGAVTAGGFDATRASDTARIEDRSTTGLDIAEVRKHS